MEQRDGGPPAYSGSIDPRLLAPELDRRLSVHIGAGAEAYTGSYLTNNGTASNSRYDQTTHHHVVNQPTLNGLGSHLTNGGTFNYTGTVMFNHFSQPAQPNGNSQPFNQGAPLTVNAQPSAPSVRLNNLPGGYTGPAQNVRDAPNPYLQNGFAAPAAVGTPSGNRFDAPPPADTNSDQWHTKPLGKPYGPHHKFPGGYAPHNSPYRTTPSGLNASGVLSGYFLKAAPNLNGLGAGNISSPQVTSFGEFAPPSTRHVQGLGAGVYEVPPDVVIDGRYPLADYDSSHQPHALESNLLPWAIVPLGYILVPAPRSLGSETLATASVFIQQGEAGITTHENLQAKPGQKRKSIANDKLINTMPLKAPRLSSQLVPRKTFAFRDIPLWDYEIPQGEPINATIVELIVLLPKWFHNKWMASRFVNNGIRPESHRRMLLAHRPLDDGNDYKDNTILAGYKTAMRGSGWETRRKRRIKEWNQRRDDARSKGETFTEPEPADDPDWTWTRSTHKAPADWDARDISVNGFVPDRIRLGTNTKPRAGVPFTRLIDGVTQLPQGNDAADLTRAVRFALANRRGDTTEGYLFPDHWHEILDRIGRTQVTPDHYDSACIKRYEQLDMQERALERAAKHETGAADSALEDGAERGEA